MSDKARVIKRLIEELNLHKFDLIDDLFDDKSVLYSFDMSYGEYNEVVGIEKIRITLSANFHETSDANLIIKQYVASDNYVIAIGKVVGRNILVPSLGSLKAEFDLKTVVVFEFREKKISCVDLFIDTFGALKTIGRATIQYGEKEHVDAYMKRLTAIGFIPSGN